MSTSNARLEERRIEFLTQARQAEELAHVAEPGMKEDYLGIARAWRQLAEEVTRIIAEQGGARRH